MSWLQDHAKEQAELAYAAAARGPKPISSTPGAGMGSYAEDDPEQHEANRTPEPVQPETE